MIHVRAVSRQKMPCNMLLDLLELFWVSFLGNSYSCSVCVCSIFSWRPVSTECLWHEWPLFSFTLSHTVPSLDFMSVRPWETQLFLAAYPGLSGLDSDVEWGSEWACWSFSGSYVRNATWYKLAAAAWPENRQMTMPLYNGQSGGWKWNKVSLPY